MCTVTLVPLADRLRVMCNRDERHTRAEAHPPLIARAGGGLALMPLDPQSGGTWIAANAAGLVFALLNGAGAAGAAGLSRGRLIPELLDCGDLRQVTARARMLCWRDWPPHRLIVADTRRVLELRLRSAGLVLEAYDLRRPLGFTSSSLGDDVVESARRALFEQMVAQADDPGRGQEAFHRHRWPDRPHMSVHMRRHDAATQSITTVEMTSGQMRMWYEPTADLVGVPAALSIDRRRPAALAVAS